MAILGKKIKDTGLIWLWLTVLVVVLDQITKTVAMSYLSPYNPVSVLPGFNLTLAFNYGAAFNFLSSAGGWQKWFLMLVAAIVSITLIIWMWRVPRQQTLLSMAIALILGGALGNLFDRIYFGYVIDFLDFYIQKWHWPAFNTADTAISIGAALLILTIFKKPS